MEELKRINKLFTFYGFVLYSSVEQIATWFIIIIIITATAAPTSHLSWTTKIQWLSSKSWTPRLGIQDTKLNAHPQPAPALSDAHGRLASVWKIILNLHMKYYKYICISIMNLLDIKGYCRILSLQETNSLASNEKWHRRSNSNLWIFIIAMYSKLSSMKRPIFWLGDHSTTLGLRVSGNEAVIWSLIFLLSHLGMSCTICRSSLCASALGNESFVKICEATRWPRNPQDT